MQLGRVDELGSGVLNVNRNIKEYSGKCKPLFFEAAVFKMTIPIPQMNGGVIIWGENNLNCSVNEENEGNIEGTTKNVRAKLSNLLKAIVKNEGQRVPYYKGIIGLSDKSIEIFLKLLKDAALIEFRGEALQTGGYFLTNKMKEILKL